MGALINYLMENQMAETTVTRGAELVAQFDVMAEAIRVDTIKFFDKGQKAAARRDRKTLSELGKFCKTVRKEISEVKTARADAVETEVKTEAV